MLCLSLFFFFSYFDSPLDRHIPKKPNGDVQSFVNDAAYRLVRAQEENMVLKPWVLLATLLLHDHQSQSQNQNQAAEHGRGMPLEDLTAGAVWLRDVLRQYGAFLHWPGTVMSMLICCYFKGPVCFIWLEL